MAVFGYESIGASRDDLDWRSKWGSQFTAPENGTLTQIDVHIQPDVANQTIVCAVYSDSGSDAPNALLASITRTNIPTTKAWYSFTGFNLPVTAGTKYWLALNVGNTYVFTYYNTTAGYYARRQADGGDPPPPSDPFGSGTDYSNRRYSIYATYTPSGGTLQSVSDSLGLSDYVLRHKPAVAVADSVGAADALLRDKSFVIADSVGASDAVLGNKTLNITDLVALTETIKALKTLMITDQIQLEELLDVLKSGILKSVADSVGLADSVLLNKILDIADSIALLDSASRPSRVLQALDYVGLADGASVGKILRVTDTINLAEVVEVGAGGVKKTRLFLVLGDLAVQLTGD